jgi:hypothetical protein
VQHQLLKRLLLKKRRMLPRKVKPIPV